MNFINSMNQRVSKLSLFDIQLIKAGNWFFALIIVKLIPDIMNINVAWFVLLLILCAIKPFYVAWIRPFVEILFKNDQSEQKNQPQNKLSFVDIQLMKAANWFFALIIVEIFPQIMNVNVWFFVLLLMVSTIKPFYVAWLKDDQNLITGGV